MSSSVMSSTPTWTPSQANVDASKMMKFMCYVNKKHSLDLVSYEDLRVFSITELSQFWAAVWEQTGIISSTPYTSVVDESIPIYEIPNWFEGARLNYAENLLKRSDEGIALISETENPGRSRSTTWKQLRMRVGQVAAALKQAGVMKGDRVAALVPNTTEV